MTMQNLIYFTVILFIASSCKADIKLIQSTSRHANRNPVIAEYLKYFYPNNPYKDRDWAPEGPMQLTKAGRSNAYDLGKYLRKRYPTLIDSTVNQSQIYVRALNETRIVDTARLIATGLLSNTQESWYPNLPLSNVSIDMEPIRQDSLNYPMLFCENYYIDREETYAEAERLLHALSDVQDLYSYLSNYTGVTYRYPYQAWLLIQELSAQADIGVTLEPWTQEIFPHGGLLDLTAAEYILRSFTTLMKRLTGGVWIKEFLDHVYEFLNDVDNTPRIKGYIYTCSEIQIAGILNTLGVYKPHVPDYLSTVLFELHEIDDEHYVKVIYKNSGIVEDLIIPGCEKSMCLLSTFISVLDEVTVKDFDEDCGRRGSFPMITS